MGFNYINSQAKSHTKAWSDRFTQSADNLFALPANPIERTFVAKSGGALKVAEGEIVHVRRIETGLVVFQGLTPLAAADKPSLALFEMVDSKHGVMRGVVTEVISEANVMIVKVSEGATK
ncbi:hypothetical protein [Caenimonas aquaedulcis]|uniref:Uncharacterized protein n=1 Tax=Caenimonas aquaedulcis TaxID=2793270 RepID=A0A931H4H0_9BURK|nr:hypothetical protein [Caenimonas aquaedulcis]MBG9388378.1 hypothetical protein [Caenimonas aquaedulcis]